MKVKGHETIEIRGHYPTEYHAARAYLDEMGYSATDEKFIERGIGSFSENEFIISAEREVQHVDLEH